MRLSITAGLVISADDENGEIDAKANKDRAKPDADHAELAEKKLTACERYETREQEATCHSDQCRKHSRKACVKNRGYQHD
jgi:hypothetical protein